MRSPSTQPQRILTTLLLLAAAALPAPAQTMAPREISPAERAALSFAVRYLIDGAESWWPHLAAKAPLRSLGYEGALAEIRVRAGQRAGAIWTLDTARRVDEDVAVFTIEFPSGFDETLFIRFAREDGWKILGIRNRVDPWKGRRPLLGPLAPLRAALEEGDDQHFRKLLAEQEVDGSTSRAMRLWDVQHRLANQDLAGAWTLLEALRNEHKIDQVEPLPLYHLLRARFAFSRYDTLEMSSAFERSQRAGLFNDGIGVESIESQAALGFLDEMMLRALAKMGSRRADIYYILAAAGVYYEDENAGDLLRIAWQQEPRERSEILDSPLLSDLALETHLFATEEIDEPKVAPTAAERTPLALPEGTPVVLAGNHLTVRLAGGDLVVPGGGSLAPPGTVPQDAGALRRTLESETLAKLPEIVAAAASPSVMAVPRQRRELETAAEALARLLRWQDLVDLTAGIEPVIEKVAPETGFLRALALRRLGRAREGLQLVGRFMRHADDSQSRDPSFFLEVAILCAEYDRLDEAVRFLRRANDLAPYPMWYSLEVQYQLDREVRDTYKALNSAHFNFRYSGSLDEAFVKKIANLFEEERRRLRHWIPQTPRTNQPTDVYLIPWERFSDAYGRYTVGLYDGKMRIPFAEKRDGTKALMGSTLTHELVHAMLTDVAGEDVPDWFHEGLAQHIEPEQEIDNPIPDLHKEKRLLAIPMLEAILDGNTSPDLTALAYQQALWTVHYLEARHGRPGLHRLINAFANEPDSARAIQQALQVSLENLNSDLWKWGLREAPERWLLVERATYHEELQAAREKREAEARKPRVGLNRRKTDKAIKELEGHLKEMRDWDRYYSARTRETKKLLRQVVGATRGLSGDDLTEVCPKLRREIQILLTDKQVFDCPAADAAYALKEAYREFQKIAAACQQGRSKTMFDHLEKAQLQLKLAAIVLGQYGLEP